MTDSTNSNAPAERGAGGRFVKGHKRLGGRDKGSRDKLTKKFVDALLAEFRRSGPGCLQRMAKEDPTAFSKLVAGLLPKEMQSTLSVNQNVNIGLSPEMAIWSEAYDAWGRFLGARRPVELIEAKPVSEVGDDSATDDRDT